MTDEPSFAARRAETSRDSTLWTPRDALVEAIRRIDAGEINPEKLIISMTLAHPDDTNAILYYCMTAKANNLEASGLLHKVQLLLADWGMR